MDTPEKILIAVGGRIRCPRCQALCKATRLQCRKAAVKGKRVCRSHGGRSTGPRTAEGRARAGAALRVHGRETNALRRERPAKQARMLQLEDVMRILGFGGKGAGRKPSGYKPITTLEEALGWAGMVDD